MAGTEDLIPGVLVSRGDLQWRVVKRPLRWRSSDSPSLFSQAPPIPTQPQSRNSETMVAPPLRASEESRRRGFCHRCHDWAPPVRAGAESPGCQGLAPGQFMARPLNAEHLTQTAHEVMQIGASGDLSPFSVCIDTDVMFGYRLLPIPVDVREHVASGFLVSRQNPVRRDSTKSWLCVSSKWWVRDSGRSAAGAPEFSEIKVWLCILGGNVAQSKSVVIFFSLLFLGLSVCAENLNCEAPHGTGAPSRGCSNSFLSARVTGTADLGGLVCTGAPTDCSASFTN